jgi:hypothetical protein
MFAYAMGVMKVALFFVGLINVLLGNVFYGIICLVLMLIL